MGVEGCVILNSISGNGGVTAPEICDFWRQKPDPETEQRALQLSFTGNGNGGTTSPAVPRDRKQNRGRPMPPIPVPEWNYTVAGTLISLLLLRDDSLLSDL